MLRPVAGLLRLLSEFLCAPSAPAPQSPHQVKWGQAGAQSDRSRHEGMCASTSLGLGARYPAQVGLSSKGITLLTWQREWWMGVRGLNLTPGMLGHRDLVSLFSFCLTTESLSHCLISAVGSPYAGVILRFSMLYYSFRKHLSSNCQPDNPGG